MKNEYSKEEAIAAKRERVPIHAARDVIKLRGLDHDRFYYRFVKTKDPDRIQKFLEAGYTFVDKGGQNIVGDKTVASFDAAGSHYTLTGKDSETLVLMALPIELWQQDQQAKEDRIRELEDQQYRKLQELSDPRTGGYGHVGAHPSQGNRQSSVPIVNIRR